MHNAQIVKSQNVNYTAPILMLAGLMYFTVNFMLSVLAKRLELKKA
jgi:putative glutamine transport system permease protein